MKVTQVVLAVASIAAVSAHDVPSTPEEIAHQLHLQESMYHCTPQIAKHLAERKRAAQVALGGRPSTDASTMFLESAFETSQDRPTLECTSAQEAKIRNHTCVLSPEVTQGPYYHVAGHPIRQNMAENQLGLPFLMDFGIIDVSTCEPVSNVLVDIWHANTTGHYAGHADPDPDLIWEGPAAYGVRKGLLTKFPRWNNDETWLRAAWPTNKNGVSQFSSIFPGYYTGRATHVHVKVHTKWTPHTNGTFTSGQQVHTGQLFVDDSINEVIDKIHPYTTNPIKDKWGRTRNWADSLNIYPESFGNGYQPTFEIEKLGGVIQQGLIGYITVGVDLSKSYDRNPTQQGNGVPHKD
ncbi:hypothetical protein RQP46_004705 [Phenoliferia psychrophenolica]